MCMPNENLTKLLEFCYTEPRLWILKGTHKLSKILTLRTNLFVSKSLIKLWACQCIPWHKGNNVQFLLVRTVTTLYLCRRLISIIGSYSFKDMLWFISGYCFYLVKSVSKVNTYDCSQFSYGCHNYSYLSTRIYERKTKYPARN